MIAEDANCAPAYEMLALCRKLKLVAKHQVRRELREPRDPRVYPISCESFSQPFLTTSLPFINIFESTQAKFQEEDRKRQNGQAAGAEFNAGELIAFNR